MANEEWAEFNYLLPQGEEPRLDEIIDQARIQSLMDEFYHITGIPVAVVDTEGKVLVATGWQDICTEFHRKNPETLKNCIESDTKLSSGIEKGAYKRYKCKNNLWDMATPIVVDEVHVGNVFCGQFFLEGQRPDYEFFRSQARRYGFDEKEYLESLERVPFFNERTLENVMHFYSKLAHVISEIGCANFYKQQIIKQQNELLSELQFHLGLQEIVSDIASSFLRLDDECIDDVVDTMLRRIGEYFNVDRSYVFIFSSDRKNMKNTHEWCAEGIEPEKHRIENRPLKSIPWVYDRMKAGGPLHIPDTEALPEEASAEKMEFRAQRIKSLICFPLVSSEGLMGFMGFDFIRTYRRWPEEQIKLLEVVAEILSRAIRGKYAY